MSEIKQVTDWIDAAGQEPSVRNVANYLAYTMSELAECLACLESVFMKDFAIEMESLSQELRDAEYDYAFEKANRTELLDGAIDTAWCAIGLAHMLGNAQGAFAEVAASNYSKMQDGVLVKDSTGKVVKGPDYFKPDLAKFLR